MSMEYKRRILPFLLVLASVWLSACAGKLLAPFATWVQLDITSNNTLNPDESGRPSPVVLRIYELKDITNFQSKDFFQIYDNDEEALGDSLIKKDELNFRPGESTFIEREFNPDAAYIGVFVAFRDVDEAHWRAFYKLRQSRTNKLKIDLHDIKVSIKSE